MWILWYGSSSLEDHEERVGTVEVDMERRDKDGDVRCLIVVDRWVGKT